MSVLVIKCLGGEVRVESSGYNIRSPYERRPLETYVATFASGGEGRA